MQHLDGEGDLPGVLLTADHGEAFGEDGYFFAHGHSLGLELIRVPEGLEGRNLVRASASGEGSERAIFAEHANRAAVVVEGRYYTRAREQAAGSTATPLSNREALALGARSRKLGPDTGLGEQAEAIDPLENALADFLADAMPARPRPKIEVPGATRDAMKALGYVDQ